jgi:hypothetical protein
MTRAGDGSRLPGSLQQPVGWTVAFTAVACATW